MLHRMRAGAHMWCAAACGRSQPTVARNNSCYEEQASRQRPIVVWRCSISPFGLFNVNSPRLALLHKRCRTECRILEEADLGKHIRMSGKAYIRHRPRRLIRWLEIKRPCASLWSYQSLSIIYYSLNLLITMTAGLKNVIVVGGSFVGLVSIPMSLQVTATDNV